MVICPDCGKEIDHGKFCPNCGALLPEVESVEDNNVEEPVVDEGSADVIEIGKPVDVNAVEEPVEEETIEVNTVDDETKQETNAGGFKKSKFCPNCGCEVDVGIAFCPQCGFNLHQNEQQQTKFCQTCGEKININAEICPHCGVRVAGVAPNQEKSVVLAAVLSFLFPGLGHLYNGLTRKGITFIIVYIISAILIFILIGFVLMIIIWIWALIDSIKTTEAINRGEYVEDKLF
ncbi:zinc-ribbon domain-containing protein [Methanobrevibacter sp.]|uniref:zinc-ribbon domain-containing protein n=1 Tax=Methanobrevibacter sp. TaxID=66852 RepID=UPI002E7689EF|nr:zinc-ribbon domain-containing protein [Methanobrevibacter sp.]MEE1336708.1 zinc ribbon domain-containing protein [Methanobrevibacter sp.]